MTAHGNRNSVSDYVGANAPEVVRRLVLSIPEVAAVSVASYSHLPLVQERFSPSDSERAVIEKALRLRLELGLPFWDSVMLAAPGSPGSLGKLFAEAATHLSLRGRDTRLNRNQIAAGELEGLCSDAVRSGTELSVLSEVVLTDGSTRHLALMDFHTRLAVSALGAVTEVCRRIFGGGFVLLESGESYHAYGLDLLPANGFAEFLGSALLFAPIIDRAYIAHQLIEGRCALRVSGGDGSDTKPVPIAIEVI